MAVIKVKEVNLEYGYPTAEIAVRNMVDQLMSCKRQGMRAVILIHGYGSSGTGGKIKRREIRRKILWRSPILGSTALPLPFSCLYSLFFHSPVIMTQKRVAIRGLLMQ
jgi:hypothetical protein